MARIKLEERNLRVCSSNELIAKAITIRLFNGSTWANLGDGRFVNRKSGRTLAVSELYRNIRTAVMSDSMVFAKRGKKQCQLYYLEAPYLIRRVSRQSCKS